MKEQDAAHSFRESDDFKIRNYGAIQNKLLSANAELTRLRSELQQKDEEISLREAQQDVMATDTVRLLDQIEYQNKTTKEDHDKIKKLEFELQQERELRKELVECIESYVDLELFANPKPIESLITKAKLNK